MDYAPRAEEPLHVDADVVISHCRASVAWVPRLLARIESNGIRIRTTFVYSKCGKPVLGLEGRVLVSRLPNLGRVDHTVAFHMWAQYGSLSNITFFLKDSSAERGQAGWGFDVPVSATMHSLQEFGFACLGSVNSFCGKHVLDTRRRCPMDQACSDWHYVPALHSFQLREYNKVWDQSTSANAQEQRAQRFNAEHRPLGAFVLELERRALAIDPQSPRISLFGGKSVVPVCYGGSFAATREAIQHRPRALWRALASMLERGDNIEEGHYTERLWAVALALEPTLWPEEHSRSLATTGWPSFLAPFARAVRFDHMTAVFLGAPAHNDSGTVALLATPNWSECTLCVLCECILRCQTVNDPVTS
eukprot:CAMPEP_0185169030 /NCGR_PEP_ID=MMETSP1139-20130426/16715_1 /TAXON_ID=298111 /ORGANISM="Pavlova sp., Strain CCMP459" /LENGTH=361 /DNA_ID=CAMNT_0027734553 /DNA_START=166 /DNA_END=1248 /DNA_ORIENTATION=+